ncbi:MAG: methyl-accepting chemotaxis protein [Spirochaetota bacterium]|jgi:methyl-accepting chemotaxis protein|nr:methyl-accepting chemotaxis protein [Spirochaetota bacterium]
MPGEILFLILGIITGCAIMLPGLRSHKNRIAHFEQARDASGREEANFHRRCGQLAANIRESADTLCQSMQGVWDQGGDKSGSMDKIEDTIKENSRIAAEIMQKTASITTIASKMEEDVLHGFAVLGKNVKKMEDIKTKNSEIINGIISLGNKVSRIRDIVRVINTIIDQTKVIAFNAALEAAGAGETGKRFAVVSGEINRLAEDIDVLTRQIREQIEDIQSASSSLIIYSEEGSDRIAEGHKLIKDLEDIFKDIRSSAEIASSQTQTITASTESQVKSSEQISLKIGEAAKMLRSSLGADKKTALSVNSLTENIQELESYLKNASRAGESWQ